MEVQKEYPLFLSNSVIMDLKGKIETEKTVLSGLEKDLKSETEKVQKNCPHPSFSKELGQSHFLLGKDNLLSKTCTECGFRPEKPKGSSQVVCDKCWGEMEYLGREPGQGGGTHHYECKSCHHHHMST